MWGFAQQNIQPPMFGDAPGGDGGNTALTVALWLVGILVPLVGSAVAAFFAYRTKISEVEKAAELERAKAEAERQASEREAIDQHYQAEREQQQQFYQTILKEIDFLRGQNRELQGQVLELENKVAHLQESLDYYEGNPAAAMARELFSNTMNSLTVPAWVHDIGNNKWYLNDAYCECFSVVRKTFWTPVNIFGMYDKDEAIKYVDNDLKVVQSGMPIEFTEKTRCRVTDPKCEEYTTGRYRKIPISVGDQPFIFGMKLVAGEGVE